jgi:signal transduction histidine kinase/ligand-binding sensor domain-containing protein/DNA-binding response OmpR family regulator
MLKTTYFILCVFLIPLSGFGQSGYFKHLSVREGLSNNYITDIAQDDNGFIWIATESGLNRFDGRDVTQFTKNNCNIVSNELNTLWYDRAGNNLWIGSQRDGISIMNLSNQTFTNLSSRDQLSTNDVTHLSDAADGGIWITHYHAGIEYFDRKTNKIVHLLDCKLNGQNTHNWHSIDDGKGRLYVGHANDGMSIVDIKTKSVIKNFTNSESNPKSLPSNTVRVIFIDSRSNIWIGTSNGLALFNPQTEECINFRHQPNNPKSIAANYIHSIMEMKDGTLWISTDMEGISILNLNNLTLLDPQKIEFRNISANKGVKELSSPNVREIFQDRYDNIWIGHYSKGLDFIGKKQPMFRILSTNGEISEKSILSIHTDKDNNVWTGSESEILRFKNNQLKESIDIKPVLKNTVSNTYITCIKKDTKGTIWFGTSSGEIFNLNPESKRIKQMEINGKPEYIYCLFEKSTGEIWAGTLKGIFSHSNNAFSEEANISHQLWDKTVFSIIEDNNGKIWVGTFGRGIFIFGKDNKLLHQHEKGNNFCSNAINHINIDSHGGMWAATRNGVAHFEDASNPTKYEIFDEKQGLFNSFARAVQEDLTGNIWISTNTGISRWNRSTGQFCNYNHHDGAPIGEFTNGCASIDSQGDIFFGSINGLCSVDPAELEFSQPNEAPVRIVECRSLSRQIENENNEILFADENKTIELPYNKNSFRISFSSPDFAQNELVEYACLMEGLDHGWYNTQGDNQVTFRNIPQGEYTFKVKSRLKNQEWDENNIAVQSFIIKPPLWLTWYAKTIYSAAVIGIITFIFLSYRNRIKLRSILEIERRENHNKQELNNERLKFYTNVTHELRTPLTLILGPLEDLESDSKLPSEYAAKIKVINSSAKRLLNLINQILDFRKTETQNKMLSVTQGSLANLVTEIGSNFKNLNRNDKLTIEIETDNSIDQIYFDAEIITTILNNLLSNALKYTPQGTIKLTLGIVNQLGIRYAEIKVADTGYGISESDMPNIFDRYFQAKGKHQASGSGIGLALVKSLAEIHKAHISVKSTLGAGSTFTLLLRADEKYPESIQKTVEKEQTGIAQINHSQPKTDHANDDALVLIIEDDPDIRNYIASSLENDYKVLTASNGLEGVSETQKHIPNIIVSDIMMPGMDGIELCRKIKEDVRTSHIPVVLLTAKDSIHDKQEGYESGADSYLTKPFSAKLLKSRIENLLESRRQLAEKIGRSAKGALVKEETPTEPLNISKLDSDFLEKLTIIIENNIDIEELDISFIKEKMNMSYSTFYRKVKGLTGITPNEFVRKVRLKNSLKLLKSETYQISEVAYMSGFNDIVYFRKCFKDEYGITPSEYAKTAK